MRNFLKHYQQKNTAIPHSVWRNPLHFIACGFGVGACPFFPGTMGTLLAIPFVMIFSSLSLPFYLLICLVLFLLGIYLCDVTNQDFGTQDHPAIVFDELATFPIVMILIPVNGYFLLIGFVLFRFFDIVKPGPIRWVDQHVHNGFGVMLDDLLAAVASCITLHLILFLL